MATPRFAFISIALTVLVAVSGCADQGSFPSLAPRPVERLSNDEPVRNPVFAPVDRQLDARIAELLYEARAGNSAFQAALPDARTSVSRAGASGSESWIEAQQAVSRLEAVRAQSVTALAQLDRMSVERAAQPTNAGSFAGLLAAVEQAEALVAAQQAEINRLRTSLRPV